MSKDKKDIQNTKKGNKVVEEMQLAFARGLGALAGEVVKYKIHQAVGKKDDGSK